MQEFGHLEGDTIIGRNHGSAVITLVERISKMIFTIRPQSRKADDIEDALHSMFSALPPHIFKSITFDCGKELSNWKTICNRHDISIFFADPDTPSQCGLNEHSNGILRRNGLDKELDFNSVTDDLIISVAQNINHRPRKSLGYKTPLEVFMTFIEDEKLSSLFWQTKLLKDTKYTHYLMTNLIVLFFTDAILIFFHLLHLYVSILE